MARKQSLANKRRSQKRRNKKRARTIRSMRQVNEGGGFMDRLRRRLRLGKSSNLPSEVKTPLLQDAASEVKTPLLQDAASEVKTPLLQDAASVDESTYEQNYSPEPLIAPSVSSVLSSDLEKEKQFFSESTLEENLRDLLQLHVAVPTEQKLEIPEEILERNDHFIFNLDNEELVLSPLTIYIKDRLKKNLTFTRLLFQTLDDNIYINKMNSIDTRLNELMNYASKGHVYLYNLFYSILKQLVLYVSEDEYYLSNFVNKKKAAKTIGILTFLDIFQDSNVVPDNDTIQESKFLRKHVLSIKEHIDLTAGGSKGNMKSKMSRRNSRTRKS